MSTESSIRNMTSTNHEKELPIHLLERIKKIEAHLEAISIDQNYKILVSVEPKWKLILSTIFKDKTQLIEELFSHKKVGRSQIFQIDRLSDWHSIDIQTTGTFFDLNKDPKNNGCSQNGYLDYISEQIPEAKDILFNVSPNYISIIEEENDSLFPEDRYSTKEWLYNFPLDILILYLIDWYFSLDLGGANFYRKFELWLDLNVIWLQGLHLRVPIKMHEKSPEFDWDSFVLDQPKLRHLGKLLIEHIKEEQFELKWVYSKHFILDTPLYKVTMIFNETNRQLKNRNITSFFYDRRISSPSWLGSFSDK
jgi:hypothetical protein